MICVLSDSISCGKSFDGDGIIVVNLVSVILGIECEASVDVEGSLLVLACGELAVRLANIL